MNIDRRVTLDFSYIHREEGIVPENNCIGVYTHGKSITHPLRPNVPRIDILKKGGYPCSENRLLSLLREESEDFALNGNGSIHYRGIPVMGIIHNRIDDIRITSIVPDEINLSKAMKTSEIGIREYMFQIGNRFHSKLTDRPEDLGVL